MRIRRENDDMLNSEIEFIAKVSDALAHPVRVTLFRYIVNENRAMNKVCTKDLVEEFGYAQATISQHMKKLVDSELVQGKNEEKYTFYYANLGMLKKYLDLAKKF